MTNLTDLQRGALDLITMHPHSRPITGTEIANRIGLKPRTSGKEGADMRSVIHALRIKGYPICASGRGYWYPASGDELKAYIESLEARANDQLEAVEGLKLGYELVGQAKGQEEVKKATRAQFRAKKDGIMTVFSISESAVEDFMKVYPDAERI